MNDLKGRGCNDAAAVHDGKSWRLVMPNGANAQEFVSSCSRLPQELVDAAAAAGVRRMMFVVSESLQIIDGAIPKNAGMDKVSEQIRLAIEEATGVESPDALVVGMTTTWSGVRKPFTMAASFDADAVEDFHASLADAGIVCAGFASLEMALLAVWRRKASGRHSFAAVSSGRAFIVPPPRGTNPGPQTAACGLRHFATDEASWCARFQRSSAAIEKGNPLHLLVLGDEDVAGALGAAGYSEVVKEPAQAWLGDVVREVYAARPNRCRGVAVPVANPWEIHRRFSSFWLVAAAIAIFALPVAFKTFCNRVTASRCAEIAMETAKLKPAADKVRKAQKALSNARAELNMEQTACSSRIAMRRPLVAFVDIAYLFCRSVGGSMGLTSLVQEGDRISVSGRFHDPEDGIRLNKAVVDYAKEKNLKIVENKVEQTAAEDADAATMFSLAFDCAKIGEVSK